MNIFKPKLKDFIYCKKRGLSKDKCDLIIETFENRKKYTAGSLGDGDIRQEFKLCVEEFVGSTEANPYNNLFLNELEFALEEYKKEYSFINEINQWNLFQSYKIQRYFPNEAFFGLHCETDGSCKKYPINSDRVLTWMIYLNDVTEGGETEFPTQNKLMKARVGNIIIWPPYWTHPHKGIVSKTQTKYIMTGWWNYYC